MITPPDPATESPRGNAPALAAQGSVGASAAGDGGRRAGVRVRLEFAAKAFLLTAFVGALVAGTLRIRQRAVERADHRVDLGRWTVLDRPAWTTLDDVRAIRSQSGLGAFHSNVFDASALSTLPTYLDRPAGVKRVASVRRVWPNVVEAVLELRRPAVAVRVPGKADLWVEVDEEGTVLGPPRPARPIRDGCPLRVVVGAAGGIPAHGGALGQDVVAAAALASSLDGFSDDEGRATLAWLDRIDVSNFGGRVRPGASEILLSASPPVAAAKPAPGAPPAPPPVTSKCVVEWGRTGDREAVSGENPFDAKASRLLQVLRLFPHLDGLKTVRVAFTDTVVVPDTANTPPQLKRALEIDGGVQAK